MFRIIAIAQAAFICIALLTWQTQACAETVAVPFGWKAGQIRHYRMTSRIERTGDLQGGPCALNGQLRVEIVQRDKTTAHVRFLLSALEFDEACTVPSIRQSLWSQLAGVSIDAVLEPIESKITVQNMDAIRDSTFQAIERNSVWLGRTIPLHQRKEITNKLRTIFAGNSRFAADLGFVEMFVLAVGASYDTQSSKATRTTLPSPFDDAALPVSVTTTAKEDADASGDLMLTVTAVFDQDAYAASLNRLVRKIAEGSASASEHSALDRAGQGASYVISEAQRIERASGWFVESREKRAITYQGGAQNELLQLIYQPCADTASPHGGAKNGSHATATDSKCAKILAISNEIDDLLGSYTPRPKKAIFSSVPQDAFLLKDEKQVLKNTSGRGSIEASKQATGRPPLPFVTVPRTPVDRSFHAGIP